MAHSKLTTEQADRAAASCTRARMLRQCLARGMSHEHARAYASRASSNFAEARIRRRLRSRRTADAGQHSRTGMTIGDGSIVSPSPPPFTEPSSTEPASSTQTSSQPKPEPPPVPPEPARGRGRRPDALRHGRCGAIEDSMRREYQELAPYIERVEMLARIAENLRRPSSNNRALSGQSCQIVSLEFISPKGAEGNVDTSLVFIDGEAFFQQSRVSADNAVYSVKVSDVFSFHPSSSAPSPGVPPAVALARLLRDQYSRVWSAMSLEAIIRSNMTMVGTELYFESSTEV